MVFGCLAAARWQAAAGTTTACAGAAAAVMLAGRLASAAWQATVSGARTSHAAAAAMLIGRFTFAASRTDRARILLPSLSVLTVLSGAELLSSHIRPAVRSDMVRHPAVIGPDDPSVVGHPIPPLSVVPFVAPSIRIHWAGIPRIVGSRFVLLHRAGILRILGSRFVLLQRARIHRIVRRRLVLLHCAGIVRIVGSRFVLLGILSLGSLHTPLIRGLIGILCASLAGPDGRTENGPNYCSCNECAHECSPVVKTC
jgi:hypothetical protein